MRGAIMNVTRLKKPCNFVFAVFVVSSPALSRVAWCMSAQAATAPADRAAQQAGAPVFRDLGNFHRKVSTTSADAQRYFDQGITLVYAFNHAEAIRSFREAARLDPNCAMAWWGVALAYGPNINKPMDPADAPKAWEAVKNARERMTGASDVEKALVEAVSKRYAEQAPADRVPLDHAYADAMRELVKQFPDDLDVATLFAESLMDLSPWDYWTKDARPKPETQEMLAALESVIKRSDNHPGANHYYIHAVEAVEPGKAIASADRLLHFAPGAGHLVHMPAHIYLRLGLYREASLSNELASKADQSYIAQCNAQGFYPATYYPHNVHFLWYTNAMEGRSAASMAAAKEIAKHAGHMKLSEAERLAPLVSLVQVRFGKWDEVLAQPMPPEDRKFGTAMWHYTRGLALAATDKADDAEKELAALKPIAETPDFKAKDDPNLPAAVLVNIAVHDLAAQIAAKKGDHDTAVSQLTEAVKVEDALPYMEPPYAYMPMRHGLGAALLVAGKPADAEQVYREDLKRIPNNGWSLFGLAQSLRAQGKADAADAVQRQFEQAWIRSDVKLTSSRF
jgi:tetratricopeptide (TPR) repeat protein